MDGESIEMRFLRGDVDRTVGTATGPFFFSSSVARNCRSFFLESR